jgi:hypothetical protein
MEEILKYRIVTSIIAGGVAAYFCIQYNLNLSAKVGSQENVPGETLAIALFGTLAVSGVIGLLIFWLTKYLFSD